MKLVAVALLVPGLLCNPMLAMAQGPIPFSAYMQAAGAQPSAPRAPDAKNQFTPVSNPQAHTHMTSGGKVMTGAGIGLLAVGGVLIAGTALLNSGNNFFGNATEKAAGYGGGAGLCAGGVTLIILGHHRRSAD